MQRVFRFYKKENGKWFVDLPEWTGDADELQMVEGADSMLDLVSGNSNDCNIEMSDEKTGGSDVLTLIHAREQNLGGGGDYLLETYRGKTVNQKLWLCTVAAFVFNQLPQKIWMKKQ